MKLTRAINFSLLFFIPALLSAQIEKIDQNVMQQIRKEGLQNSKIMDIAFNLTDANGPRLTASPGFMKAANWSKNKLSDWGLTNTTLDPWGDFGKGWELQKSYLAMTSPWYKPLQGYPKVWTGGTNGQKSAEVILITAKDSAGMDAYRGKLKGKILIVERTDKYNMSFKADAARYTDSVLERLTNYKPEVVT
jgi:hypothetical protein